MPSKLPRRMRSCHQQADQHGNVRQLQLHGIGMFSQTISTSLENDYVFKENNYLICSILLSADVAYLTEIQDGGLLGLLTCCYNCFFFLRLAFFLPLGFPLQS